VSTDAEQAAATQEPDAVDGPTPGGPATPAADAGGESAGRPEVPAADAGGESTGGRWTDRLTDPLPRLIAVGAVLALLGCVLVITAVFRGKQISPLDESTHADYAWKTAHLHLPRAGDVLDPQIREEWSCHGSNVRGLVLPPCGTDPGPLGYPARGENYNSGHPPVYYVITGAFARAYDAIRPGDNFITGARLVGVFWLLAAMGVLYTALRRFDTAWPYAALGAALLPLTPGVLHANSTVNNDAPAVLGGALALLLLARVVVQRKLGWVFPFLVTGFIASTKVVNAIPMAIVALVFLLVAVWRWRDGERREAGRILLAAGAIVVAILIVHVGWTAFQSGRSVPGWQSPIAGISNRPVVGLPFNELLSTSFTGFPLTGSYVLQPDLNSILVTLWARLLTALVGAAPFVALLVFRRPSPQWLLALGALLGMLLYPLIIEVQIYVGSGDYFPALPVRYGMSLVPWAVGALVLAASQRRIRGAVLAVAAFGGFAMLASVTGLI
jgi:hypothetical protein